MPAGMQLKSEGFASNLSDPRDDYTLARFCEEQRLSYRAIANSIPLDLFHAYGMAFQRRFVPDVEERRVVAIRHDAKKLLLILDNDEAVTARCVVVAVGIHDFRHIPGILEALPRDVVSHAADHSDLDDLSRRRVTVIGAGSSAVEFATLLHERGGDIELVSRSPKPPLFQAPPVSRPRWRRVLRPLSGIGYGWHSVLMTEAPQLFRFLAPPSRGRLVDHYLRPSPGWFIKQRFDGRVRHLAGYAIESADMAGSQVEIGLRSLTGEHRLVRSDHIVAGTGYRLDISRLTFLAPEMLRLIRQYEGSPLLSHNFESSVSGLYFLGPLAANCFGPSMRFVLGARFTTVRLAKHLARVALRSARKNAKSPWVADVKMQVTRTNTE